jgi:putative effector of murein hydrolase
MRMSDLPAWPDAAGIFWLAVTIALYVGLVRWRKKADNAAWAQPLLWGAGLIMAALLVFDIDLAVYQKGGDWLIYILALSTVSIAVPIYDNRHVIRAAAKPFFAAMTVGSFWAVASAWGLASWLDFDAALRATLATKSITSPFAYGAAEEIGGLPVLAMGIVIVTGNFGVLVAPHVFSFFGLHDIRAQGLALGVAAHGIGTAEAVRRSALMGSFAGLAMGLNGVLTSLVLPLVFL